MKRVSRTIRWVLATIVILMVVAGSAYAYVALTGTGKVTVIENLSWVGDSSFTVSLYPQESVVESLTLANASEVEMDVDIISAIDPDPGAKGMAIDVPAGVTVPANGQAAFSVTITAGKSAEPIAYTITFEISR